MVVPVGLAILYGGTIAAGWVIRSLGYGVLIKEGNDIIKDISSSKAAQNPTSWSLQILKEFNSNHPPQRYFY